MLKGFPPLLPLHAVTPPIKAILEIIKKKCALLRLMVFMQKSGRLYPKSRPAWLPSPRGTVWHRALWLLYLGQVAYFCASTWRNDWYRWNLEHGRAYSRLFFPPASIKGAAGDGKAVLTDTKRVSLAALGFLLQKVEPKVFFWMFLFPSSTTHSQGISAWEVLIHL